MLALTVGGSPAPVRASLCASRPDRALFIVSEAKGEAPGSRPEVENKILGSEGCPAAPDFLEVPADDPDRAFALILTCLEKAEAQGFHVVADYTGGTKSMSGALMLAASLTGACDLRLMTGQRSDLRQVVDGTERPIDVPAEAMSLGRTLATVANLMRIRSYAAALAVLPHPDAVPGSLPGAWRQRVSRWRNWLLVMDCWDRFDHAGALKLVDGNGGAGGALGRALAEAGLLNRLQQLAAAKGKPSPLLCEDLWWNAQRRADQAMFDDAVARLYRLAEAAVQARLFAQYRIETGKVPPDRLPPQFLRARPNLQPASRNGCYRLGLSDARALLAQLDQESPVAGWWEGELPPWQSRRNNSILAHGFKPMTRADWNAARDWFAERARHLWRDMLSGSATSQLPDRLPSA